MVLPWINKEKSLFQQFFDFAAEATGLLEHGRALELLEPNALESRASQEAADRLVFKFLDLTRRMQEWMASSDIGMPQGPPLFTIDRDTLYKASRMRIRLRGYSSKVFTPGDLDFDQLQAARLVHIYWTVLLELYMVILGSSIMRFRLEDCAVSCVLGNAVVDQNHISGQRTEAMLKAECRRLADDISLFSEFCSQSVWQSFGPMSKSCFYLGRGILPHGTYAWSSVTVFKPGGVDTIIFLVFLKQYELWRMY